MHTGGVRAQRFADLVSPHRCKFVGIGEVLTPQPKTACGVVLGEIVPVGWMEIANGRAHNEFSCSQKKQDRKNNSAAVLHGVC